MTRLTKQEIEVIRTRAEMATEGPWRKANYAVYGGKNGYAIAHAPTTFDANFIANAREDIPKLLAEVERLQSQVDRMVSSAYEYLDTSTHTYMVAEEIEREDA